MGDKRLDVCVREKMNISRQKAQELIDNNSVTVNGKIVNKSSFKVDKNDIVEVGDTDKILKYVGRGGYKLERAVKVFDIHIKGICVDIGSSTGGFTDCMLQNGAEKVFAVDVGSNQLADKLRSDTRVISMEDTDIRNANIPLADFIGCDVSFISLTKIFGSVYNILKDTGSGVFLIKPQFEAGREKVGKKGVVRDPKVHEEVIEKVRDYAMSIAMEPCHLSFSPIKGPEGNIEYLLHLKKHPEGTEVPMSLDVSVEDVVKEAHGQLD